MHLVSHVEGELRPDMTTYDALRACFPAGTVSGAPKIRAMEIIAELEQERRGPYGGAVAYFSYNGNMDTALVLRTGIFKDGVMYVQAGGEWWPTASPRTNTWKPATSPAHDARHRHRRRHRLKPAVIAKMPAHGEPVEPRGILLWHQRPS